MTVDADCLDLDPSFSIIILVGLDKVHMSHCFSSLSYKLESLFKKPL